MSPEQEAGLIHNMDDAVPYKDFNMTLFVPTFHTYHYSKLTPH